MPIRHLAVFALCVLLGSPLAHADSLLKPKGKPEALLPVDQAFQFEGAVRQGQQLRLDWVIAPGYYLYGHTLKVTADAPARARLSAPKLGKGERLSDAEFGEVEVYRGRMQATLAATGDAKTPLTLRVRYQGCADIGVCYPPQTRIVAVK